MRKILAGMLFLLVIGSMPRAGADTFQVESQTAITFKANPNLPKIPAEGLPAGKPYVPLVTADRASSVVTESASQLPATGQASALDLMLLGNLLLLLAALLKPSLFTKKEKEKLK